MPMRVLIVDDHEAIRRGVRYVLEGDKDVEVIAEAGDGEQAIEQTKRLRPDLIIMDISMPVRDGFSAAAEIKKFYPQTNILVFSSHVNSQSVAVARNLGLDGYVSKDESAQELVKAIDAVIHHQTYFQAW